MSEISKLCTLALFDVNTDSSELENKFETEYLSNCQNIHYFYSCLHVAVDLFVCDMQLKTTTEALT